MEDIFYKNKETDVIWWTRNPEMIASLRFTFDKKKLYDPFADYPHNLSKEEIEIFDKENPEMAEYYSYRKK